MWCHKFTISPSQPRSGHGLRQRRRQCLRQHRHEVAKSSGREGLIRRRLRAYDSAGVSFGNLQLARTDTNIRHNIDAIIGNQRTARRGHRDLRAYRRSSMEHRRGTDHHQRGAASARGAPTELRDGSNSKDLATTIALKIPVNPKLYIGSDSSLNSTCTRAKQKESQYVDS